MIPSIIIHIIHSHSNTHKYHAYNLYIVQGPLARFGDTAANTGTLMILNAHPKTKDLPILTKTICASSAAASWRIVLMPIDACKTTLQVEGKEGLKMLLTKFKTSKNQNNK